MSQLGQKPEVIQLERHVLKSRTSSGRPGMSASAYSTHPARLAFGCGGIGCGPRCAPALYFGTSAATRSLTMPHFASD